MPDPFNYCTRCGSELQEREARAAAETDRPPICLACVTEIVRDAPRAVAEISASLNHTLADAFEPMVKSLGGLGQLPEEDDA